MDRWVVYNLLKKVVGSDKISHSTIEDIRAMDGDEVKEGVIEFVLTYELIKLRESEV